MFTLTLTSKAEPLILWKELDETWELHKQARDQADQAKEQIQQAQDHQGRKAQDLAQQSQERSDWDHKLREDQLQKKIDELFLQQT